MRTCDSRNVVLPHEFTALYREAEQHYLLKRFADACHVCENALTRIDADASGNPACRVLYFDIYHLLADSERNLKRYSHALLHYAQAIQWMARSTPTRLQRAILYDAGSAALEAMRHVEATSGDVSVSSGLLRYTKLCFERSLSLTNIVTGANLGCQLIYVYLELGDFPKAISLARRILGTFYQLGVARPPEKLVWLSEQPLYGYCLPALSKQYATSFQRLSKRRRERYCFKFPTYASCAPSLQVPNPAGLPFSIVSRLLETLNADPLQLVSSLNNLINHFVDQLRRRDLHRSSQMALMKRLLCLPLYQYPDVNVQTVDLQLQQFDIFVNNNCVGLEAKPTHVTGALTEFALPSNLTSETSGNRCRPTRPGKTAQRKPIESPSPDVLKTPSNKILGLFEQIAQQLQPFFIPAGVSQELIQPPIASLRSLFHCNVLQLCNYSTRPQFPSLERILATSPILDDDFTLESFAPGMTFGSVLLKLCGSLVRRLCHAYDPQGFAAFVTDVLSCVDSSDRHVPIVAALLCSVLQAPRPPHKAIKLIMNRLFRRQEEFHACWYSAQALLTLSLKTRYLDGFYQTQQLLEQCKLINPTSSSVESSWIEAAHDVAAAEACFLKYSTRKDNLPATLSLTASLAFAETLADAVHGLLLYVVKWRSSPAAIFPAPNILNDPLRQNEAVEIFSKQCFALLRSVVPYFSDRRIRHDSRLLDLSSVNNFTLTDVETQLLNTVLTLVGHLLQLQASLANCLFYKQSSLRPSEVDYDSLDFAVHFGADATKSPTLRVAALAVLLSAIHGASQLFVPSVTLEADTLAPAPAAGVNAPIVRTIFIPVSDPIKRSSPVILVVEDDDNETKKTLEQNRDFPRQTTKNCSKMDTGLNDVSSSNSYYNADETDDEGDDGVDKDDAVPRQYLACTFRRSAVSCLQGLVALMAVDLDASRFVYHSKSVDVQRRREYLMPLLSRLRFAFQCVFLLLVAPLSIPSGYSTDYSFRPTESSLLLLLDASPTFQVANGSLSSPSYTNIAQFIKSLIALMRSALELETTLLSSFRCAASIEHSSGKLFPSAYASGFDTLFVTNDLNYFPSWLLEHFREADRLSIKEQHPSVPSGTLSVLPGFTTLSLPLQILTLSLHSFSFLRFLVRWRETARRDVLRLIHTLTATNRERTIRLEDNSGQVLTQYRDILPYAPYLVQAFITDALDPVFQLRCCVPPSSCSSPLPRISLSWDSQMAVVEVIGIALLRLFGLPVYPRPGPPFDACRLLTSQDVEQMVSSIAVGRPAPSPLLFQPSSPVVLFLCLSVYMKLAAWYSDSGSRRACIGKAFRTALADAIEACALIEASTETFSFGSTLEPHEKKVMPDALRVVVPCPKVVSLEQIPSVWRIRQFGLWTHLSDPLFFPPMLEALDEEQQEQGAPCLTPSQEGFETSASSERQFHSSSYYQSLFDGWRQNRSTLQSYGHVDLAALCRTASLIQTTSFDALVSGGRLTATDAEMLLWAPGEAEKDFSSSELPQNEPSLSLCDLPLQSAFMYAPLSNSTELLWRPLTDFDRYKRIVASILQCYFLDMCYPSTAPQHHLTAFYFFDALRHRPALWFPNALRAVAFDALLWGDRLSFFLKEASSLNHSYTYPSRGKSGTPTAGDSPRLRRRTQIILPSSFSTAGTYSSSAFQMEDLLHNLANINRAAALGYFSLKTFSCAAYSHRNLFLLLDDYSAAEHGWLTIMPAMDVSSKNEASPHAADLLGRFVADTVSVTHLPIRESVQALFILDIEQYLWGYSLYCAIQKNSGKCLTESYKTDFATFPAPNNGTPLSIAEKTEELLSSTLNIEDPQHPLNRVDSGLKNGFPENTSVGTASLNRCSTADRKRIMDYLLRRTLYLQHVTAPLDHLALYCRTRVERLLVDYALMKSLSPLPPGFASLAYRLERLRQNNFQQLLFPMNVPDAGIASILSHTLRIDRLYADARRLATDILSCSDIFRASPSETCALSAKNVIGRHTAQLLDSCVWIPNTIAGRCAIMRSKLEAVEDLREWMFKRDVTTPILRCSFHTKLRYFRALLLYMEALRSPFDTPSFAQPVTRSALLTYTKCANAPPLLHLETLRLHLLLIPLLVSHSCSESPHEGRNPTEKTVAALPAEPQHAPLPWLLCALFPWNNNSFNCFSNDRLRDLERLCLYYETQVVQCDEAERQELERTFGQQLVPFVPSELQSFATLENDCTAAFNSLLQQYGRYYPRLYSTLARFYYLKGDVLQAVDVVQSFITKGLTRMTTPDERLWRSNPAVATTSQAFFPASANGITPPSSTSTSKTHDSAVCFLFQQMLETRIRREERNKYRFVMLLLFLLEKIVFATNGLTHSESNQMLTESQQTVFHQNAPQKQEFDTNTLGSTSCCLSATPIDASVTTSVGPSAPSDVISLCMTATTSAAAATTEIIGLPSSLKFAHIKKHIALPHTKLSSVVQQRWRFLHTTPASLYDHQALQLVTCLIELLSTQLKSVKKHQPIPSASSSTNSAVAAQQSASSPYLATTGFSSYDQGGSPALHEALCRCLFSAFFILIRFLSDSVTPDCYLVPWEFPPTLSESKTCRLPASHILRLTPCLFKQLASMLSLTPKEDQLLKPQLTAFLTRLANTLVVYDVDDVTGQAPPLASLSSNENSEPTAMLSSLDSSSVVIAECQTTKHQATVTLALRVAYDSSVQRWTFFGSALSHKVAEHQLNHVLRSLAKDVLKKKGVSKKEKRLHPERADRDSQPKKLKCAPASATSQ